jgi:hypothetical protein
MFLEMSAVETTAQTRARLLEEWCQEFILELLLERRVVIPRSERHANEALLRPTERFQDEKLTARRFLDIDIPRKELRIDIALLVLQFANYRQRALFILGDHARRNSIIEGVRGAGGVMSEVGKWTNL